MARQSMPSAAVCQRCWSRAARLSSCNLQRWPDDLNAPKRGDAFPLLKAELARLAQGPDRGKKLLDCPGWLERNQQGAGVGQRCKGVRHAAWPKHTVSRLQTKSLRADLQFEFPVPYVKPFILAAVHVEWRTAFDGAHRVINAIVATCVLTRQFALESPTSDVHRGVEAVSASLYQDSFLRPYACVTGNQHEPLRPTKGRRPANSVMKTERFAKREPQGCEAWIQKCITGACLTGMT